MDIIKTIDELAQARKNAILDAADELKISGTAYFLSNDGNDSSDGLTPESAWKTLGRLNAAALTAGDGVFFRRGDIFRGSIVTVSGVSYGAYGTGEKPRIYAYEKNLGDAELWEEVDSEHAIWRYKEKILDVGTLVFGNDELCSRKLIPSYVDGRFVCRDDESREFDMAEQMTQNLDLFWYFDEILTTKPSKNLDFPIPVVEEGSFGTLYLRSDLGNPATVYGSIEALIKRPVFKVRDNANVTIDNICIKYVGHHAITAGGHVVGLHVSNCEIGWIGGTIQHYDGTDPNYPQGSRGSVTRFGNAIEIYGGCEDYRVENCYIYQVYDAGITHQITTNGKKFTLANILYENNLVEYCVYAIEYFLDMTEGDTESIMDGVVMRGNILRRSGYGWGQQRHNVDTPALIKGWSYINRACNYVIENNIFDRSAYRMLHLVALDEQSLPIMSGNTYVQYRGGAIGQYGANKIEEPEILIFDDNIEDTVANVFGDTDAKIYIV